MMWEKQWDLFQSLLSYPFSIILIIAPTKKFGSAVCGSGRYRCKISSRRGRVGRERLSVLPCGQRRSCVKPERATTTTGQSVSAGDTQFVRKIDGEEGLAFQIWRHNRHVNVHVLIALFFLPQQRHGGFEQLKWLLLDGGGEQEREPRRGRKRGESGERDLSLLQGRLWIVHHQNACCRRCCKLWSKDGRGSTVADEVKSLFRISACAASGVRICMKICKKFDFWLCEPTLLRLK